MVVPPFGQVHVCGRPIKRLGLCGVHARAKETRERNQRERTEQFRRDREHRDRMAKSLAVGNNVASLLRQLLPDVHFIAQESGREVVLEVDLGDAVSLLRHLDPHHEYSTGDLGLDVDTAAHYVDEA
jgi:hypothetical protein